MNIFESIIRNRKWEQLDVLHTIPKKRQASVINSYNCLLDKLLFLESENKLDNFKERAIVIFAIVFRIAQIVDIPDDDITEMIIDIMKSYDENKPSFSEHIDNEAIFCKSYSENIINKLINN